MDARKLAKGVGWRLGLLLASILVTLVIAEVVAHFMVPDDIHEFFTPFVHDDTGFTRNVKDEKLLYTLAWYIPGATGMTGSAKVRINNLGLRDERDYPLEKPKDCFRVLGLGDSMTFGKGVEERETFLGRLEARLRGRFPDRCIEILNAGMPNTNFYTQWIHYQLEWHKFKPDLIVVAFFVYNDTQLQGEEEPYSLRWMELVDANPWLKKSSLVRWMYYRGFFDLGADALADGLPRFYDPDYEGWQQFRETVEQLKTTAATNGSELAFVLVPIPEGYDEYPHQKYHDQVTRLLTVEHRIPTWDLLKALRGIDARKHWVHPSDGHPDAFVHDQMSLYMFEAMPWTAWLDGK